MSTVTSSSPSVWKIALAAIGLFILSALACFGVLVLGVLLQSPRPLLYVALIAAVLGIITVGLVRFVRRRRQRNPGVWWRTWLKASIVWALVVLALVAVPILGATWINATQPMLLPHITLTNGEKQVIFQGMVHVGSEPFYQGVVFDMLAAKSQPYDFFFEGVRPGSAESQQKLKDLLGTGGRDLNEVYKSIAVVCGLKFQTDYFSAFTNDLISDPDRYVLADVTTDDMIDEWERLISENPALADEQAASRPQADPGVEENTARLVGAAETLAAGPGKISALLCQAYFNTALEPKPENEQPPFSRLVVLDFRNRQLADRIINHPGDQIYLTYGAAHIPGVYRYLRERDPRWQIGDVEWRQAIQPQTQRDAELDLN
jgi:hypothetical protein